MAKTFFEQTWSTYTQGGNCFLPDLKLLDEEHQPIGIWGQRHRHFLKAHRGATYASLLTSGKLNRYLVDLDRQAEEMFSRLVEQMAEAESITEELKVADQMAWVGRMNNVRNRAKETVNKELIYDDNSTAPTYTRKEPDEPPKVF